MMRRAFSHIKNNLRWYVLAVLIFSSATLWYVCFREDCGNKLTFAALNVGQGDGLFIESPTCVKVLVDGGPENNLIREIPTVMPWYDRHIDAIIITNSDSDHYSGFISLLDKYKVDAVIESGYRSATPTYAYLEKKIADKGIPEIIARRGQIIDMGGGAYIKILFPDRDVSGVASNDASIVSRLVYGDTSVLLQGDSPIKIEDYLTQLDGDSLQSTILKVGHHGSKTSTSDKYVKTIKPQIAVISAEKGNSYGFPHQQVLDILNKYKVQILGTYDLGRIILQSDGKEFVKK